MTIEQVTVEWEERMTLAKMMSTLALEQGDQTMDYLFEMGRVYLLTTGEIILRRPIKNPGKGWYLIGDEWIHGGKVVVIRWPKMIQEGQINEFYA